MTIYRDTMLRNKMDWWTKIMMTNTHNAKYKQVKTQHVNYQNESIVIKKNGNLFGVVT